MSHISREMKFCINYTIANSFLTKKIDRSMSAHGISYSEFIVLLHLDRAPEKSMRRIDLAEKVALSASGVTRMLKPMEKIGLVTKEANARDARVSLVKLTDAGMRIVNEAKASLEYTAGNILSGIKPEDLTIVDEVLKALGGSIE
jgi:DNA-binding MarR family transcriptional regulator